MGNLDKGLADIQKLKDAGYEVRLYGITLDPIDAAYRAQKRAEQTFRYVPLNELMKAHQGFATGFNTLADQVDYAGLYDNSGKDPVRIAVKENGKPIEILDEKGYKDFRKRGGFDEKSLERNSGERARGDNAGTVAEGARGARQGRNGPVSGHHGETAAEAGTATATATEAVKPPAAPSRVESAPDLNAMFDELLNEELAKVQKPKTSESHSQPSIVSDAIGKKSSLNPFLIRATF